jgi:hypothetical protein
MGVTFRLVKVAEDGSETLSTTLPAISPNTISRSTRAKKYATAIRDKRPIWIPLGSEGPTVKSKSKLHSSADYTSWDAVQSNDLLYVSTSTLNEFPSGSYWWVDQLDISREGGWVNLWILDMTLERSWYNSQGDLR